LLPLSSLCSLQDKNAVLHNQMEEMLRSKEDAKRHLEMVKNVATMEQVELCWWGSIPG
jgi:hypothetical protein